MSSNFVVYDDTTVYDIYGRSVNVTITLDLPETKAYNITFAYFTIKVSASILAPGGDMINSSEYLVIQNAANLFDCYLISGFILDYDRTRAIDTLWQHKQHNIRRRGEVIISP